MAAPRLSAKNRTVSSREVSPRRIQVPRSFAGRSTLRALLTLCGCFTAGCDEQVADPNFDASVARPAYSGDGPHVLFDEGHFNFHTTIGRYKPFADLIRSDGYRVTPSVSRLTAELLDGYEVLAIANALGAEGIESPEAARSAFTDPECKAVRDWVDRGGSLLLITDHHPTGSAVQSLAREFEVYMSTGTSGHFEFTAHAGLPGNHPIIRGRDPRETVQRVRTYTGQSLNGPPGSAALLVLPEDAVEGLPTAAGPHVRLVEGPAMYPAQAVALRFGAGRVVVLGEAAVLSAQIRRGKPVGMNAPGLDNRQFALNIMHWLSGLLPDEQTAAIE